MRKPIFRLLSVACLLAGTLWAANDPFVGKWKLNPSGSILTDEMKVQSVGANKYALNFDGTDSETITADGADHPGLFGSTLAITADTPDTWKVVRKKDGHLLIAATWKLSEDGNSLRDAFTGYRPNGSTFSLDYIYKRTAGSTGFAGTWESTSEKVNSVFELEIRPYEEDGLSFVNSGQESSKNMRFDGKDYPNQGPNVPPGSASSARRVNERALEMTDKINGKTMDTQQVEISADLKTLTMTVRPVGRNKPNVLVFDRE